ncbi:MAG TPA: hypothetical protein VGJ05_11020 [Fimbriiglobus sp.]|jgi:hypothetical protein
MLIDVDTLNENDLLDLNRRVIERLRFLQQARAHSGMLQFAIGEPVSFPNQRGVRVFGVISRYNKKTVTVVTDSGHTWTVSPQLLTSERTTSPAQTAPFGSLLPPKG